METFKRWIEKILPWYSPEEHREKDARTARSIVESIVAAREARELIESYRSAGRMYKRRGSLNGIR